MSYILDALEKSERERALLNQDDFKASSGDVIHPVAKPALGQNVDMGSDQSNSWWVKGVYLILGLLLMMVLVKVFERKEYQVAEHDVSREAETIEPNAINSVSMNDDGESISQVVKTAVVTEALAEASVTQLQEDGLTPVAIEQAPERIVDRLPVLEISSHIFSSQAERRSIVVNGQRLIEGEYVAADIQIKEITPQGMIIDVNGWSLIVGRSRGWGL